MPSTKEIYDTITPKVAKKKFVILAIIAVVLLAIILFYLFLHDSKNITYTTIKPIKAILHKACQLLAHSRQQMK